MRYGLVTLAVCAVWLLAGLSAKGQAPAGEPSTVERADQIVTDTREKVEEIATNVDKSEQAQEVSAGILKQIYAMAEYCSFSWFHWVAFAIMVTGVVSYALQLVLAKLVLLMRLSISFSEILSDALGLVISLVGLMLTTQAAVENSAFTQSAAAVLSATGVGVLAGFIFYLWGQSQELRAVAGRRKQEPDRK